MGKVFLFRAAWNQVFVREFDTFPGEYDDQIDTVGAGYTKLTGKKIYSTTWGRQPGGPSAKPTIIEAGKQQRAAQFSMAKPVGVTWGKR
jgi:hypothetical protein